MLSQQRSRQRAAVKNIIIAFVLAEALYLAWWLLWHKGADPFAEPLQVLLQQGLWLSPLVLLPIMCVNVFLNNSPRSLPRSHSLGTAWSGSRAAWLGLSAVAL